jgi:hypothetical protein
MRIPWYTNAIKRRPHLLLVARRGVSMVEAMAAISLAVLTVAIATQMMASAQREHQVQVPRTQALRELDNALEMAFWIDASQLEDASLAKVAATTVESAQAAGTAPEELAITLTIADDPTMPPRTKRIDAIASYRERRSGLIVTLPTLSIWRTAAAMEKDAAP